MEVCNYNSMSMIPIYLEGLKPCSLCQSCDIIQSYEGQCSLLPDRLPSTLSLDLQFEALPLNIRSLLRFMTSILLYTKITFLSKMEGVMKVSKG